MCTIYNVHCKAQGDTLNMIRLDMSNNLKPCSARIRKQSRSGISIKWYAWRVKSNRVIPNVSRRSKMTHWSVICSTLEIHRRRRYATNWVLPNGSLNDVVLQFTCIKANARWYTCRSATNWVICDGSLLSLSSTQTTAATYRATWWVGPEDTCDHLSPYIFLDPYLKIHANWGFGEKPKLG